MTPSPWLRMRTQRTRQAALGLSLIELMVVVAVAALLLGLAAPAFNDYIVTQRVRSIHAQLVSDLQYARSEAIGRGSFVSLRFQHSTSSPARSCYVIYTRPNPPTIGPDLTTGNDCDCLQPEGQRCAANPTTTSEIRTVVIDGSSSVQVRTPPSQSTYMSFDPRVGGRYIPPADTTTNVLRIFSIDAYADDERKLRASLLGSGRILVCAPSGSRMGGEPCT